jgi:hypothetical protein
MMLSIYGLKTNEDEDEPIPEKILYSALVGALPAQYHHVRTSYENSVKFTTPAGQKVRFVPDDFIKELRQEFSAYRAHNSRAQASSSTQKKGGQQAMSKATTEKGKERAAAAVPYPKAKPSKPDQSMIKCFNCNELGHSTMVCPKPWTEKSKIAMKKGFTRKSIAKAMASTSDQATTTASASLAVAGPSTPLPSMSRTSSSMQADWVNSLSGANVEMKDSDGLVSHFTFPAFTIIPDQDYTHIIDSGASIHCTPYRDLLFNVHMVPAVTLTVANSKKLDLRLAGDMHVEILSDEREPSYITLKNVYFHSQLPFTLISVPQLDDLYTFSFRKRTCTIYDNAAYNIITVVPQNDNLYSLKSRKIRKLSGDIANLTLYQLHKELGHMSYTNIEHLMKTDNSIITKVITDFTRTQCEDCILNNLHRLSVPKQRTSKLVEHFGDHFHIDIFGPLPVAAISGYLYWLTIVDDCTRWLILAPLKSKDKAYAAWVTFTTELFTQYGIKVKILQCDNDAVFTSHAFRNYLKAQGTKSHFTVHDTPEQNGVAENVHQHIMNCIRVNLHTANLPDRLWWYAALYTMYMLNRTPKSALQLQTPYFKRYGVNANLDNLQPFGTPCIVYDEARPNKLALKGKRGVWLGFDDTSKGHYVYFGTRVGVDAICDSLLIHRKLKGSYTPQKIKLKSISLKMLIKILLLLFRILNLNQWILTKKILQLLNRVDQLELLIKRYVKHEVYFMMKSSKTLLYS